MSMAANDIISAFIQDTLKKIYKKEKEDLQPEDVLKWLKKDLKEIREICNTGWY